MKHANPGFYYSLLAALCVTPTVVDAGIRVGSASRNNAQAYQQVYASAATPGGVVSATPVVTPTTNNTVTVDPQMERCSMIYPTGEFAWTTPTIGRMRGASPMCTSVVRMIAVGAGQNGEDAVIATANLAAGDTIRCNIESFPSYTHSSENISVTVPADHEPTMEDVIQIMNQEQKQNAGWKIIGSALTYAVGGNIAGGNEPGKDGVMGFGKEKMTATGIAAAAGAAIETASIYSGKVAGDTIRSAGINAAAGGMIGNVAASAGNGKKSLRIEKCEIKDGDSKQEVNCLWGVVEKSAEIQAPDSNTTITAYVKADDVNKFMVCETKNREITCQSERLTGAKVSYNNNQNVDVAGKKRQLTLKEMQLAKWEGVVNADKFCYKTKHEQGNRPQTKMYSLSECEDSDPMYIKLEGDNFKKVTSSTPAIIPDIDKSDFRKKNWDEIKNSLNSKTVYRRNGSGNPADEIKGIDIAQEFRPLTVDASDGGIIDMDNKSRMGGTLAGVGVGGAMGAYSAYQGAQSEIEERWVAAVREYKDSLQNIVCMTGQRFLAQYNDPVIIPAMSETAE